MIPKVIHYIWLGGKKLPKIAEKCITSWKKYCPDYEIKKWDETNLNIDVCNYVKQAYENKKYAFVSDFFRFDILYREGGIYLDIDVELLKNLDGLLSNKAILGFENEKALAPGLIMACEKGNEIVKLFADEYYNEQFIKDDKSLNEYTICERVTNYFVKHGLILNNKNQKILGFEIFSSDYFCPKSLSDGIIRITDNTVAIHHYLASWVSPTAKFKNKVLQFIKRIIGEKNIKKLKNIRK